MLCSICSKKCKQRRFRVWKDGVIEDRWRSVCPEHGIQEQRKVEKEKSEVSN